MKIVVEYPKKIFVEGLIFYMRKKFHEISQIAFLHELYFLYEKLFLKNILILRRQFLYTK